MFIHSAAGVVGFVKTNAESKAFCLSMTFGIDLNLRELIPNNLFVLKFHRNENSERANKTV